MPARRVVTAVIIGAVSRRRRSLRRLSALVIVLVLAGVVWAVAARPWRSPAARACGDVEHAWNDYAAAMSRWPASGLPDAMLRQRLDDATSSLRAAAADADGVEPVSLREALGALDEAASSGGRGLGRAASDVALQCGAAGVDITLKGYSVDG